MCGVTSENKKMVELVVNGAPVSFYDVNNGNTIGALSFLNKVIETLAGDNAELLDEAIVSQFTIDARNIGKLESRTIASDEVALHSTAENEELQVMPYSDKPFVYAAKLSAKELVAFLYEEYLAARNRTLNAISAANKVDEAAAAIRNLMDEKVLKGSIVPHPESSLHLETNQLPGEIAGILFALDHSKLRADNLLGLGLQKEEIPTVLDWHRLNTQ
ncbi:hypothetical protein [Providencia rettgeri]|uniref:hypothetical protein n=1 Tax=Providencia rettgeri TaxID=587 RepID=UPI003D2E641B